MKRRLLSVLSLFLVTALLGLAGCEGGGVEPGMGDASKPGIPLDEMKKMANMADGTTPPPGVKMPKKEGAPSAAAPAPAEAGKDAPKN